MVIGGIIAGHQCLSAFSLLRTGNIFSTPSMYLESPMPFGVQPSTDNAMHQVTLQMSTDVTNAFRRSAFYGQH
jgi:hypothetical protein